ncbi:hypothetical protein GE09DRAFT_770299 [Coniochaeta sp. 2T2.1]|nr:hypothetical protein GE09DRAFT_770299 [Coniochaeta sp. 2T2.1]
MLSPAGALLSRLLMLFPPPYTQTSSAAYLMINTPFSPLTVRLHGLHFRPGCPCPCRGVFFVFLPLRQPLAVLYSVITVSTRCLLSTYCDNLVLLK